jgi:hypothetical protein
MLSTNYVNDKVLVLVFHVLEHNQYLALNRKVPILHQLWYQL